LLAAFRNCDTMNSNGPHKVLIRGIRMLTIKSSFPKNKLPSGFVLPQPNDILDACNNFINKYWDRFPMHFVTHLIHAAEVLGFHHPDHNYRDVWRRVYVDMVTSIHLMPEPYDVFDKRLLGDVDFIKSKL